MVKEDRVKPLDRFLQRWRILKARPYIPPDSRLLDVGCADGMLYRMVNNRVREYVGIDPSLKTSIHLENYRLIAGQYPFNMPELPPFKVITMLAVIEHLTEDVQIRTAQAVYHHLEPNGLLLITTPSPHVDHLLHFLKRLRLIDGMALEEHSRFDVRQVPQIFTDLKLILHRPFQLGLNHLFVFQKF